MSKTAMLLAGAAGYVLGTRAGRERYEQIKSTAQRVARDPRVQRKAQEAQAVVKDKVSGTVDQATAKMRTDGASGSPSSI